MRGGGDPDSVLSETYREICLTLSSLLAILVSSNVYVHVQHKLCVYPCLVVYIGLHVLTPWYKIQLSLSTLGSPFNQDTGDRQDTYYRPNSVCGGTSLITTP